MGERVTRGRVDGVNMADRQHRLSGTGRIRRMTSGKRAYRDFVHSVRRMRPSQLIPALARLANAAGDPTYDFMAQQQRDRRDLATYAYPWRVALVARESILNGTEHRKVLDERQVNSAIRRMFNAERDLGAGGLDNGVQSALIRVAHEQFGYQTTVYEEIGRTHSMLVAPLSDARVLSSLRVIGGSVWTDLLGASLSDTVGATILHWASAHLLGGRLRLDELTHDAATRRLLEPWPRHAIEAATGRLVATVDEFKADFGAIHPTQPAYLQYAYNPLNRTPFVRLPGIADPIAPQPRLILNTLTPASLYHLGRARYGNDFSTDMGYLFEEYVGRNLRLLDGIAVEGEREYSHGREQGKTVDWIAVFPELVLLVEVKSRRLAIADIARDDLNLDEHVGRLMKDASSQIVRSHNFIEDGRAVLSDIPKDRPHFGLVVTAEPVYLANTHWVREHLGETSLPISVASIRDIENLVRLPASTLAAAIATIMTDDELRTWDLSTAIAHVVPNEADWGPPNPLVEEGWSAYPWPDEPHPSDNGA